MKIAILPQTKLGKIGFGLMVLALLLLGLFFAIEWIFDPQGNGGEGFFSVPVLAITILGVWLAGSGSLVCSIVGIFRKERSLAMILPLLLGAFIFWFGLAELIWGA